MSNLNTSINNIQHDGITATSNTLTILEKLIARSCSCKLREICLDKNSQDCLKHKNIYAQEMCARNQKI